MPAQCKQAVWARRGKVRTSLSCEQYENTDACAGVLREALRVRMQDSVMKFGYACTFTGKPRGETPAPPPEKTNLGITAPAGVPRTVPPNRQVHLPRYACSPSHWTPPASCVKHTRLHSTKHAMTLCIGQSSACLRDPDWPA
jgi:hypothetical protein